MACPTAFSKSDNVIQIFLTSLLFLCELKWKNTSRRHQISRRLVILCKRLSKIINLNMLLYTSGSVIKARENNGNAEK